MKDEIRKHLIDILHASEEIEMFVSKMDFASYKKSLVTQRGVERNFEIIGEALNRIRKVDEDFLENISDIIALLASETSLYTVMTSLTK